MLKPTLTLHVHEVTWGRGVHDSWLEAWLQPEHTPTEGGETPGSSGGGSVEHGVGVRVRE